MGDLSKVETPELDLLAEMQRLERGVLPQAVEVEAVGGVEPRVETHLADKSRRLGMAEGLRQGRTT